jgi:hypothetical protein
VLAAAVGILFGALAASKQMLSPRISFPELKKKNPCGIESSHKKNCIVTVQYRGSFEFERVTEICPLLPRLMAWNVPASMGQHLLGAIRLASPVKLAKKKKTVCII